MRINILNAVKEQFKIFGQYFTIGGLILLVMKSKNKEVKFSLFKKYVKIKFQDEVYKIYKNDITKFNSIELNLVIDILAIIKKDVIKTKN